MLTPRPHTGSAGLHGEWRASVRGMAGPLPDIVFCLGPWPGSTVRRRRGGEDRSGGRWIRGLSRPSADWALG